MSPIVALIIMIKNGYMSRKEVIESTCSTFRVTVLKKLKELGYIQDFEVSGDKVKKITIKLKYDDGVPAVTDVKLFSKPGRRWYVAVKEMKPVIGGLGYALISTPKGVLTNKEARKLKVGGELLFEIW